MSSGSSDDDDDDDDDKDFLAFLAPSPSKSQQPSNSKDATSTKRMTIQRDRQATLFNRSSMEMHRKTRLAMTSGETQGSLQFVVSRNKLLRLPPSKDGDVDALAARAVRTTLYRRFECLQPNRQEDDAPYLDAICQGMTVSLVKALPKGYERGGWRCHALIEQKECLHPNKAHGRCCAKCHSPKPINLKPAFTYIRLLLPGMRQQRREYVRMIKECDSELCRCEVAEQEANAKIGDFDDRIEQGLVQVEDEEVELTMDVDLIQKGVWQRGNARTLLPMLLSRKDDLHSRLRSARAEVAIMIQCTYELAVVHVQKIVRRFLVRCRLNLIKQTMNEFARLCVALEIQRLARGKLAKNLLGRLRQYRDCLMATKIQSIARMRKAVLERRRLWDIYFIQLQHQKATVIQSMARGYAAKMEHRRLTELRRIYIEKQQTDRISFMERNAATLVQSVYRRHLGKIKCKNRRIEMSLHSRLLMYLERYAIDGCMWTFVKSINGDYLRFERTIKNVIEREEKMAKTFVEKVVKARDEDHSSAWNKFHSLKEDQQNWPVKSKLALADAKKDHIESSRDDVCRKMNQQKRDSTVQIYENALSGKKRAPTNIKRKHPPMSRGSSQDNKRDDNLYRREANICSLRLRGSYTRFDIPNGLDDTIARFIRAVSLRYECDSQDSNLSSSSVRQVETKRLEYADELIHAFHKKGFVFIRQLLPFQHMRSALHTMAVDKDFILLSHALLTILQRMDRGNYLARNYLMTKCNSFLDTQESNSVIKVSTGDIRANKNLDIINLLGECGAAGCGEEFDDEIPAGLFEARNSNRNVPPPLPKFPLLQSYNKKKDKSSWAVKCTQKVIESNETKHPAYQNYRRGQLLANT